MSGDAILLDPPAIEATRGVEVTTMLNVPVEDAEPDPTVTSNMYVLPPDIVPDGTANSVSLPVNTTAVPSKSLHEKDTLVLLVAHEEYCTMADAYRSLEAKYGAGGSSTDTIGEPGAAMVIVCVRASEAAPRKFIAVADMTVGTESERKDAGKETVPDDVVSRMLVRFCCPPDVSAHSNVRGRAEEPTVSRVTSSQLLACEGPFKENFGGSTIVGVLTVTAVTVL